MSQFGILSVEPTPEHGTVSDPAVSTVRDFSSARPFRLWEFRVSHSLLLVRSPRSAEAVGDENLDLIFVGVDYLALPDHMSGVHVTVGSSAALAVVGSQLARPVSQGCRLYEVGSEGRRHLVVAAQLVIARTTCNIMESSLVLHFSPDEEAERRFRREHLVSYALVNGL
jgi:hypothetical protein